MDSREAADRGAVEHQSVGQGILLECGHWNREVLHHARKVAEADIDERNPLLLNVGEDLGRVLEHVCSFIDGVRLGRGLGSDAEAARCAAGRRLRARHDAGVPCVCLRCFTRPVIQAPGGVLLPGHHRHHRPRMARRSGRALAGSMPLGMGRPLVDREDRRLET